MFTRGRVEIGDDFFAPDEITVTVRATVTWQISQGENDHDVVSTESLFRSNSPYVSSYHIVAMVGKIVVK